MPGQSLSSGAFGALGLLYTGMPLSKNLGSVLLLLLLLLLLLRSLNESKSKNKSKSTSKGRFMAPTHLKFLEVTVGRPKKAVRLELPEARLRRSSLGRAGCRS